MGLLYPEPLQKLTILIQLLEKKTGRERERETQRQRERGREGEGIRKGILTVEIWNAVDTANDIKQLKKEVKVIESLGRPGVLQFFLVRSEHTALRDAGVEWPS